MPQLNSSLFAALGTTTTATTLSYKTTTFVWTADVTRFSMTTEANELLKLDTNSGYLLLDGESSPTSLLPIGEPVVGNKIRWVDVNTLIFESSQSGQRRLYTYNIKTNTFTQVSIFGADHLYADGGVWARWLDGDGYQDSLDRGSDTYDVAGIDTDGTVLIIIDANSQTGLGYLLPTHILAENAFIFTYNTLTGSRPASIRNQIVVFKSDEVLHQYRINTEERAFSNVPLELNQNDGEWIVGQHGLGAGCVVFNLNSSSGWVIGPANKHYNPDIRAITRNDRLLIATSKDEVETSYANQQTFINTIAGDMFDSMRNLYNHNLTNRPRITSTTTPLDMGATIIDSDVITKRTNITDNSGVGVSQAILSSDWFGTLGGKDIRGAWQYGITAVVAASNSTGSLNVTVKDSNNNTYATGETAYGNASVIIRPASESTTTSPLWEVIWVRNATTYARVILNAALTATTPITQETALTFNTHGILDIDTTTNLPIPAYGNEEVWYGYVKLQYPITRGNWTVGKDVSPTCPSNVERLIAWNHQTQTAYVVWNANTQLGSITAPAHIAVEYNTLNIESAAVVPPHRHQLIHEYQWQKLSEEALQRGIPVGTR